MPVTPRKKAVRTKLPARSKVANRPKATTTTGRKTATRERTTKRRAAAKGVVDAQVRAMSLHIGLNAVNPKHYAGWSGDLSACENDAKDMAAIARSRGMVATALLTSQATRARVLAAIRSASGKLKAGDFFFLSYSGHGGQVDDVTGEDEPDKKDETWCLYDAQLIDDELYLELCQFAEGVRILVLSDSCHSGTVVRAAITEIAGGAAAGTARPKWMPRVIAQKTYESHKRFYDQLQQAAARRAGRNLVDPDAALAQVAVSPRLGAIAKGFSAAAILISGCQDNQTSLDGDRNGAFTERLLAVWNHGMFGGNYARFHAVIKSGMPPNQSPNFFTLGAAGTFVAEQPFQVGIGAQPSVSVDSARKFVRDVRIPTTATRSRSAPETIALTLDAAKTQAAVVGSGIVSFGRGVTAERRESLVNSSLLAQLVATKQVTDPTRIYDWYNAYFEVLSNVGWVVQDKGFAEYQESGTNFEAHKAILAVASVVLGAAPTALAIITSTIEALHSMDDSRPWITIFDRESRRGKSARFQISLAEQDNDGQFFVNLLAFGLEASSEVTQVLFFKVKKEKAKLQHYSGRVSMNSDVLDGVREAVKAKLLGVVSNYVSQLPDL